MCQLSVGEDCMSTRVRVHSNMNLLLEKQRYANNIEIAYKYTKYSNIQGTNNELANLPNSLVLCIFILYKVIRTSIPKVAGCHRRGCLEGSSNLKDFASPIDKISMC